MARLESKAVGGYYATPPELLPLIARHLDVRFPVRTKDNASKVLSVCDPCAGDGAALFALVEALVPRAERAGLQVFACELERTRAAALGERMKRLHGSRGRALAHDAFRVQTKEGTWHRATHGASLLYLNPPYDQDPECVRLEERFLRAWAPELAMATDGDATGVLVFVVPFYALAASAETLGKFVRDVTCVRFPDAQWKPFQQVVLFGRATACAHPDPQLVAQLRAWSVDPTTLPVLGAPPSTRYVLTPGWNTTFSAWEPRPVDLAKLVAAFTPWHETTRGGVLAAIPGVLPTRTGDLLARTYPVAMPPRPAHVAAGIAGGVFNGARLAPNDAASGLPPILVKGTFDREWSKTEDKKNKDGDVVGHVEQQRPKLVVTALDLRKGAYHTLAMRTEITGARALADMTTADLLDRYGDGIVGTLQAHCPPAYDPQDSAQHFPLPALPRALFRAQAHAVRACVTLLGGPAVAPTGRGASRLRALRRERAKRRGKAALLLGEIGVGKSTVALATGRAIGARRTLVVCPPHLLDGWRDQAGAVLGDARVVVLSTVTDVDRLAAEVAAAKRAGTPLPPVVAVLSRETAKLGHGIVGTDGTLCPTCGGELAADAATRGRTRAFCPLQRERPKNLAAQVTVALALLLVDALPDDPTVYDVLTRLGRVPARTAKARRAAHQGRSVAANVTHTREALGLACVRARGFLATRALPLIVDALADATLGYEAHGAWARVLACLVGAIGDAARALDTARTLWDAGAADTSPYGSGARLRSVAYTVAALAVRQDDAGLDAFEASTKDFDFVRWVTHLRAELDGASPEGGRVERVVAASVVGVRNGRLRVHGEPVGHGALLQQALHQLVPFAVWSVAEPCGAPVHQAVPDPRRYPLASYVAARHPRLFDFLVFDEAHELSSQDSAQGRAASRLAYLGAPRVYLTGSVMNGYAESLFQLLWDVSPAFREEFDRSERPTFVQRYGYQRRYVSHEGTDGKVAAFGAVTDRVERKEKPLGPAPGVLPLLVLRHLLPVAVTLQMEDLDDALPPCREITVPIEPTPALRARHQQVATALVTQIRQDSFTPLSGKLWGQMAELPSHLDRATADTGNVDTGAYSVAYPESVGGRVVVEAAPFPAADLLPKEAWCVETVRAELAEGRRVLVFAWHAKVLPRLQRLLAEALGEPVALLDANKVQASKRQGWIDREVIAKKRRVLVVNPVAVQTGLNNLVWFATAIYMQNPACNPVVYRQSKGRISRIGQTLETRVYFPIYAGTTQEPLHRLLLQKVAVSMAVDGVDAQGALEAAGASEDVTLAGMALGKQLYELITERMG